MTTFLPLDRAQLLIEVRLAASSPVDVSLAGEIDRDTSGEVHRAVVQMLDEHHPPRVSLDMRQVTFLDSSGIRALLRCLHHAEQRGIELRISQAHANVLQVLAVTSLLEVFGLEQP